MTRMRSWVRIPVRPPFLTRTFAPERPWVGEAGKESHLGSLHVADVDPTAWVGVSLAVGLAHQECAVGRAERLGDQLAYLAAATSSPMIVSVSW